MPALSLSAGCDSERASATALLLPRGWGRACPAGGTAAFVEEQKRGKARMRRVGRVDVPQEAFISALRVDDGGAKEKKK